MIVATTLAATAAFTAGALTGWVARSETVTRSTMIALRWRFTAETTQRILDTAYTGPNNFHIDLMAAALAEADAARHLDAAG